MTQPNNIKPVPPELARKKGTQKNKWKRNIEYKNRYSSHTLPIYPTCGHMGKAYKCKELTMRDIKKFHEIFYSVANKIQQDNFILKYCHRKQSKQSKKTNCDPKRSFSLSYTIKNSSNKLVSVCRTFLNVLCIKKDRVLGVPKRHIDSGQMASERRGGNHKQNKFAAKKAAVMNFIEKFQTTESHYCRSKTAIRTYLPSELNIRKMWRMYVKSAEVDKRVKQSYFRNIFNKNYNIGFGAPQTDACSKCLELKEKIKVENDNRIKQNLMTEKRVHKLRAKAFNDYLREDNNDILILSFDCQKNQALPKIPDQSVYYSRQFYIYNFTIVTGHSHTALTKENVNIYAWTENTRPKSANEIASAVFHRLCNINDQNITTVRLMADGCGGQNKNTIMIGMCSKWLSCNASNNIKTLELIFPVVGHSFIPPDRVFARIEKVIKKRETIISPEEYIEIFNDHGTVYKLGTEVPVLDWKSAASEIVKPPSQWHFQFNMSKRFILKRGKNNYIAIQGEQSYRSNIGLPKLVYKKGKSANLINPIPLQTGNEMKKAKCQDVDNLLKKHFGENWRTRDNLNFYKMIIDNNETNEENNGTENSNYCLAFSEIPDLIV